MSLNSLLQSPDASQRAASVATVGKWERTGLLEGLKSETERAGMAQLLENQARQLVKEASQTGTAEGSEEWAGVALPLVRRIFAEFAAKEFVSVQPMNLPSGLVFYLDFKYGNSQPGFTADQTDPVSANGHPFGSPESDDSLFGVTNTTGDPTGGLYGAGRFGYSINDTSSTAATATTASGASAGSGSFNFDSAYTNNLANYSVIYVSTASLVNPDYTAVRSFVLTSGSNLTAAMNVPAFTKYNAATGRIEFVVSTTGSLNGTAAYTVQQTTFGYN